MTGPTLGLYLERGPRWRRLTACDSPLLILVVLSLSALGSVSVYSANRASEPRGARDPAEFVQQH